MGLIMQIDLSNSKLNTEFDEIHPTKAKRNPLVAQDLTQALGKVPVLRISRLSSICETSEIYLKLEACNPGGSIKEKNAAYLIKDAESKGILKPGGTIVESSSGNFGIGLAMIGAARGYRVMIVVDAKSPGTMRKMLAAYGAELVDVPLSEADEHGSMQVARMKKAKALAQSLPLAWYPCQHLNPLNPLAHKYYTANELEELFGENIGTIVVGLSTAGQIAGISQYFRERNRTTRIIGVDVAGSAILGTPPHPYKMTGLGLSFVPPNFKPHQIDAAYSVSDSLAFSVCRRFARKEGLLLGASTGAIMAAALADIIRNPQASPVVVINPDRGDRYLDTIYNDEWIANHNIKLLNDEELEKAYQKLDPIPENVWRSNSRHQR